MSRITPLNDPRPFAAVFAAWIERHGMESRYEAMKALELSHHTVVRLWLEGKPARREKSERALLTAWDLGAKWTAMTDDRPFAEVLRDWMTRMGIKTNFAAAARIGTHNSIIKRWLEGKPVNREVAERALLGAIEAGLA